MSTSSPATGSGPSSLRWGTSLITFYEPTFAGFPAEMSYPDYITEVYKEPRRHFDAMLDGAVEAGLQGIELAPEPGGWSGALKAYGSVEAFKAALASRSLTLTSSYEYGMALLGDGLADPANEPQADSRVHEHAEFLAELGCGIMVMGTPSRLDLGPEGYHDVPRDLMGRLADQLNRLAGVAQQHQVQIALHTDAYSLCSRDSEIDLLMSLTDPTSVALCLDSGHVTLEGTDAVAVFERHIDRIPVAHWKDADGALDGLALEGDFLERHDVMLQHFRWIGEGAIDWQRWIDVAKTHNWSGWAIAELDMAPNPIHDIERNVELFRKQLSSHGSA